MKATTIRKIDSTKTDPTATRAHGGPQTAGLEYDKAYEAVVFSTATQPVDERSTFGGFKDLGSVTGSPDVDFSLANHFSLTAGGNLTPTFSKGTKGRRYTLAVKQDGTGSRTVTWPAAVRWPAATAPTLTTTAAKTDIFEFIYDGTNFNGSTVGLNYT